MLASTSFIASMVTIALTLAPAALAAPAHRKRTEAVQVIHNCTNEGQVALTFDGESISRIYG